MAVQPPIHAQRGRAESFGNVAADYDRYRPGYPSELIDDLLARCAVSPPTVLDIGCGTGKAARLLAARGARVLGVEIDPKMAAVARSHGVEVEVAAFEDWNPRGRTFDLIICAQAWHWVDPARGAPKLRTLLTGTGPAALFWNFDEVDEPVRSLLDEVYLAHAPQLRQPPAAGEDPAHRSTLESMNVFRSVQAQTFPWRREVPVDEWIAKVGTHSDHLLLGEVRLRRLQTAMGRALAGQGYRSVPITGGTYVILLER